MLPEAPWLPSIVAFLTLGSNFMPCSPTLFNVGWVLRAIPLESYVSGCAPRNSGVPHLQSLPFCSQLLGQSLSLVQACEICLV